MLAERLGGLLQGNGSGVEDSGGRNAPFGYISRSPTGAAGNVQRKNNSHEPA
jgi:hypothetical protein